MSIPNVAPLLSRAGPLSSCCNDPEPSTRLCWLGSARIANTTSGGASMSTDSEMIRGWPSWWGSLMGPSQADLG
jgi:hypothetical protein